LISQQYWPLINQSKHFWTIAAITRVIEEYKSKRHNLNFKDVIVLGNLNKTPIMEFIMDGFNWAKSNEGACANCKLLEVIDEKKEEMEFLKDAIKEVKNEAGDLESIGNGSMKDCNKVLDDNVKEGEILEIIGTGKFKGSWYIKLINGQVLKAFLVDISKFNAVINKRVKLLLDQN
jgi:hypothetical protein